MTQADEQKPEQAALEPFEVFFDTAEGVAAPLPPALAALYGRLAFPDDTTADTTGAGRAWVISNFVSSIDGVVAYTDPVPPGQGEISGGDPHDRAAMGLLRAVADAVIVGAGTLRSVPRHLWTPAYIYPPLAAEYAALRAALGKPPAPLNVIVSGRGDVDIALPVFQQAEIPALLLTSLAGAERLRGLGGAAPGPRAHTLALDESGMGDLSARATLDATVEALTAGGARAGRPLILVEGGPRLLGRFAAERLLDEQFLTIAPQLVGRDEQFHRLGLIEGQRLAPAQPHRARLVSARRAGSFLFLRYHFARAA